MVNILTVNLMGLICSEEKIFGLILARVDQQECQKKQSSVIPLVERAQ